MRTDQGLEPLFWYEQMKLLALLLGSTDGETFFLGFDGGLQ